MDPDLTPAQSSGCIAKVHCPRCREFYNLDLLAFKVAGTENIPWRTIFPKLICSTCKARPNFLWVGIDEPNGPGVKKFQIGSN